MRNKSNLFFIDNQPLLEPDEEVGFSYEDLDDSSSGRDESGAMHREVIRFKVGKWEFSYSHLTEEEKNYIESLFDGKATFFFKRPARLDSSSTEETLCYRSKYSLTWKNARTGLWNGYKFNIIEC